MSFDKPLPESSMKFKDDMKPFSAENNESDSNVTQLSREEVLRKRKERRKAKQEERRAEKEKLLVKKKLNKQSDKVKIITPQVLEKYKTSSAISNTETMKAAIRKFRQKHNLLEYIVERKQQAKPLPRIETPNATKLNKGKKREFQRKHYTRLKKQILKYRTERKAVNCQDIAECVSKFEQLKVNENTIQPPSIHSRKFRPYCDNTTSKEICHLTEVLLKDLFRYQKRAYEKNNIKARVHRRYVVGFKEVQRQIEIDKVKLVIFAPDCEPCGSLDDTIERLKSKCKESDTPYLFSVKRKHLGFILFKKVAVNCVGVLSYDGSQEIFKQLMESLKTERENYISATTE